MKQQFINKIQKHQQSPSQKLNIVILGDVDSGKSTLVQKLLQNADDSQHDKKTLNQVENDILGQEKMCLDIFKDENESGEMQQTSYLHLNSQKYQYNFIDVPGHKDFIKNMVIGKSRIDAALFVISAFHGEFEYGFQQQGLIKAQILLAQNLGIQQIIFIINKMDDKIINYSQHRFEEIVQQLKEYLEFIRYNPLLLRFVPTSGYYGENLFDLSPKMNWYFQKSLIQTLYELIINDISINQPLRLPITDVYKIGGVGVVPAGTIVSGILKPGMQVYFSPCNILNEIKYFEMTSNYEEARVGDRMGFSLTKQISVKDLRRGYVCSDAYQDPAMQCEYFDALVSIIEAYQPIQNGYSSLFLCHTARVVVKLEKIYCKLNRRTGQVIEQEPKKLYSGDSAIVKLQPTKPLCVEKFSQYPKLGRFVIKNSNKIEIVGIIIKVEKKNIKINL